MYKVGIDIGSTSAKVVAMDEKNDIIYTSVLPTGWSSLETAVMISENLEKKGLVKENSNVVATGYGRISVPYADKTVTEITCHGKGAAYLFDAENTTVIDIGGQDTKVITLAKGNVVDFIMNDKCSAGTGRFLEIMANTLGLGLNDMCELARQGRDVSISSMCTVFAESEVIGLIGSGREKKDIAFGVIDSIANKVKSLCSKHTSGNAKIYLTGGLCENSYIIEMLSHKLESEVISNPMGRYAGAVGAAIMAGKIIK
ncbi:MAG: acyl-CoA dehydratase activase [Proteocatella sp.]